MKENKYDFFISHASEDKNSFVRPLVEALTEKGYRVWYDESSLKIGDSLIQNISNGIKNSLYGIIVLSENFFEKTWTKKELEALISKEIITDDNLILPIWLNIDVKTVYEFSPLLVDKIAIQVNANQVEKAVIEIEKKAKLQITTKEKIREKINLICTQGPDRRIKYAYDLETRIRNIFLFQEEFYNIYTSEELFSKDEDWDQMLVDQKGKELQFDYDLPNGVWLCEEPFPWSDIFKAIKLAKKWVNRDLNYYECQELHFLLDEVLDTDVYYTLYGFPHSSMKHESAREEAIKGIFEVGIGKPSRKKRKIDVEKVYETTFLKYYT
ncbi:MAG: molecular chaperone Tir [Crocinitomicaceae bacterium]|jgi:hypothetical protein|nr:molecular chaperone Tir [Crocinitomicaceae bacterium]